MSSAARPGRIRDTPPCCTLLTYFGESHPGRCGNCDNCLSPSQTWDGTVTAQKALSCVYRTGQRFGAAHLIDVLRGADSAKVQQFGHQHLSTFGIGQELDARQWRSVFRQLVAAGLLEADVEGYGALRLTADSGALLRGERTLALRSDPPATRRRGRRDGTAGPVARSPIDLPVDAAQRFDALRQWRAGVAREQNLPAYVVFHDRTLRAVALDPPGDLDALSTVEGIGAAKLARYGEQLLAALERATDAREA